MKNAGHRRSSARVDGRSGFTLVELLVVVAIIALLAAMLVPSLNHVMIFAREVQCRSNLHNIGNAVSLYMSNNRMTAPWVFDNGSGDYPQESGNGAGQPGCPTRALTADPNEANSKSGILPDGRLLFCPLAPITYEDNYERTPPGDATTFWGTYDWQWRKRPGVVQIKFTNPASNDVVMLDSQPMYLQGDPYWGDKTIKYPGEHYNVLMVDNSVFLLTRDPDVRQEWLWGPTGWPY
ncbi:MAG: type II secretion system protein [bacterium]|nr:type II secretion system protein [bacterium]